MLEIPGKEGLSTAASALLGQPVKAKSALVIVWITNHGASNVYKTRLKFELLRYIKIIIGYGLHYTPNSGSHSQMAPQSLKMPFLFFCTSRPRVVVNYAIYKSY